MHYIYTILSSIKLLYATFLRGKPKNVQYFYPLAKKIIQKITKFVLKKTHEAFIIKLCLRVAYSNLGKVWD